MPRMERENPIGISASIRDWKNDRKRFMTNEQTCKWCENKSASRGVCAKHYARCAVLVSDGATWETVLAGDEPQPGKRGRPIKTGSASWLAEKYDELANDVTKAIALIELGNTDEAKRVLMGDKR